MTAETPPGEPTEAASPAELPRIVITFAGDGAADMRIEAIGDVEPAQVYGAAYLIDLWAHEVRASLLASAAMEAQQRAAITRQIAGDLRMGRPS